MTTLATLDIAGPIATLTLRREEARNALSIDLLSAIGEKLGELESLAQRHAAPTVLSLTGAGKAFCAGMDLKAVRSDPGLARQLLRSLAELAIRVRVLPCVTIAKVNGAAIGGGCGLATVCDLAITHADSKMGFPEVDLGVCPAVVAPWLVRKIGPGLARRVLLSGGLMSGQRAFELGIVDHVTPDRDGLDAAAADLAGRLATGGPSALRATKALLNQLDNSADLRLAHQGADLSASILATPEAQAMLRAKLGE